MRVLLQNLESKHFYRGRGAWTSNPEEAFDFQYSRGLRDYSERLDSPETRLVIAIHQPSRRPTCETHSGPPLS